MTENRHDRGVLVDDDRPGAGALPASPSACARRPRTIGERLGIVGAYCIEFFVLGDDVYVNEIAPRVHNSGHYSLDATQISQYEAHVRAICDLPLDRTANCSNRPSCRTSLVRERATTSTASRTY